MDIETLSDEALMAQVECLARTERFTLVDFLIHLGELDRRDACERKGYPSAFSYLTKGLGYAECDAMRRVRAARAGKRFPSVLRLLAEGKLHIVGLAMLQPHLTSDNYRSLLGRACGMSQREIERMVAGFSPAIAEPRDRIRPLPASPRPGQEEASGVAMEPPLLAFHEPATASPVPSAETDRRGRMVFTFSAGEDVEALFLRARDILRHRFPDGKMEDVIGEALRRLVETEMPRPSRRARPGKPGSRSRVIAAAVRHEVWSRDGGRCAFTGPDGLRCPATAWLEYDHVVPWSLGGRSDDPANIRLLCRAHNQAEARRLFGGSKGDFRAQGRSCPRSAERRPHSKS